MLIYFDDNFHFSYLALDVHSVCEKRLFAQDQYGKNNFEIELYGCELRIQFRKIITPFLFAFRKSEHSATFVETRLFSHNTVL